MNALIRNLMIAAGLSAAFTPASALAGEDQLVDSIERVIPYDGVLDIDGSAYNGLLDVIFTLYGASDGGDPVWTETWSAADGRALSVTAGRFSVNLGTHSDIEGVIAGSDQVFLGMQVKRPDDAEYTALVGRQRLNPVPYSLWTTRATHLNVSGTANVGESLAVVGNVTSDAMVAADRFFIEGVDDVRTRLFSHYGDYLHMGLNDGSLGLGLRVYMPVRMDQAVTHNGFVSVTAGMSLVGGLQMDDGNGHSLALSYSDSYLRIGNPGRFGSGLLVENDLRTTGDADVDTNLNVDGTSRLRGNTRVDGTFRASQCRICINTRVNGIPNGNFHTCVAMTPGADTGYTPWRGIGGGNNIVFAETSMVFLCDGGGNSNGAGNIDGNGDISD